MAGRQQHKRIAQAVAEANGEKQMVDPAAIWSTVRSIVPGAWSAIGPLVGVFVGAYLSSKWQRKQWLLDNRKQECREVLSALSAARLALIDIGAQRLASGLVSGEEEKKAWDLVSESYRVMQDRIFISRELRQSKALSRWIDATKAFDHKIPLTQNDIDDLSKVYSTISALRSSPDYSATLPL